MKFKLGHLYVEWSRNLILYTRSDLLKIHKRFAHPTAEKLQEFVKRANPEEYSRTVETILEDIVPKCNSCQRMAPKPYTFQVSVPEDIQFNHEFVTDITWIESRPHRPALYIVDRGTHFSAARFLIKDSSEYVWNCLVTIWVSLYVGSPNIATHDYGVCFESEFFKTRARILE